MMTNAINEEFFNVSINHLSVPTVQLISTLLNPKKFILTKATRPLPRDWRGLADLTGCSFEDVSSFNSSADPTVNVLKRWSKQEGNSVKLLLLYFLQLDRYDVFDDSISLIIRDISCSVKNNVSVDTSLFITQEDRIQSCKGLPPVRYDACLLYADEDEEFVVEKIVWHLENKYKLRIFMKERDLIGGTMEHDAIMEIIANRCEKLVIILSPAFLQSSENKFFISFAQCIGIEQRKRKIIPCVYKPCEIPVDLRPLHRLKYTNSGIFFFEKLYSSIVSANTIAHRKAVNNISLPSLESVNKDQLMTSKSSSTTKDPSPVPETISKHEEPGLPEVNKKSSQGFVQEQVKTQKKVKNTKTRISNYVRKKLLKKEPMPA